MRVKDLNHMTNMALSNQSQFTIRVWRLPDDHMDETGAACLMDELFADNIWQAGALLKRLLVIRRARYRVTLHARNSEGAPVYIAAHDSPIAF